MPHRIPRITRADFNQLKKTGETSELTDFKNTRQTPPLEGVHCKVLPIYSDKIEDAIIAEVHWNEAKTAFTLRCNPSA